MEPWNWVLSLQSYNFEGLFIVMYKYICEIFVIWVHIHTLNIHFCVLLASGKQFLYALFSGLLKAISPLFLRRQVWMTCSSVCSECSSWDFPSHHIIPMVLPYQLIVRKLFVLNLLFFILTLSYWFYCCTKLILWSILLC